MKNAGSFFLRHGSKWFCSSGDIRELAQKVKEKDFDQEKSFFADEFDFDLMIHNSSKPVIVIAYGINMGGGLGIAAGPYIVIVTERTRMAMPESRIGFFSDLGITG
jgi:enoyl-CoA hydratase